MKKHYGHHTDNQTDPFLELLVAAKNFAGMDHNEDTTNNIDQIHSSVDLMSIFLQLMLRDFLYYTAK